VGGHYRIHWIQLYWSTNCTYYKISVSDGHFWIGQLTYKESSDCPGNLKWNPNGITIMGGDKDNYFSFPSGLFIEPKTQILYVSDITYNYVLKRYPNGKIQVAAGQSDHTSGSTSDKLDGPKGVYADENENVYVSDWSNQRIQLWEKDAKRGSTVAGNGMRGDALTEFSYPSNVIVDSHKNILVSDLQNQRITQWPPTYDPKNTTGIIVAGGHGAGIAPPQLYNPVGLYFDQTANNLYIANEEAHTVVQWNRDGYGEKVVYAGIP
ncbi:unnamed protein product, partial [Adineta ricciae]